MGKIDERDKHQAKEPIFSIPITGTSEIVNRYGSAVKEHVVAYTGVDNKTGTELKKSLKSVAEEKVHPDYQEQNLKQQAGFSAEIKETANTNAENIIKGSSNRKARTDDVGRVNDPLYDHIEIDGNGSIIDGSGSQMKFVGNNPEEALDKLVSSKYQKYLDNDVPVEVPADYYDQIQADADHRISELQKQLKNQQEKGNTESAEKIQKKIDTLKKVKKNLKKSTVSSKEAMFARKHPVLSTAKSIADISHRAGMEAVTTNVTGDVARISAQNIVAVINGEEEAGEAVMNVAKTTVTTELYRYGSTTIKSAVTGTLMNSKSKMIRSFAEANLPGKVIDFAVVATQTIKRIGSDDFSLLDTLEQLGQEGAQQLGSALFTAVGQVVIPIPVVGGLIGGMVGYVLTSVSYGILTSSLKEAKLAREERMRIEKECEEHIRMIREYRAELEKTISQYFVQHIMIFHQSFNDMKKTLEIGDIDGFISSANTITETLGKESLFQNIDEFEEIMSGMDVIKL